PDAARILAMSSAGGEIGVPRAPAPAPSDMAAAAPEVATNAKVDAVLSQPETAKPVLIPVAPSGASGSGLLAAAAVAAALILVQAVSTWLMYSPRPSLST